MHSKVVYGAYLSHPWSDRNLRYFGKYKHVHLSANCTILLTQQKGQHRANDSSQTALYYSIVLAGNGETFIFQCQPSFKAFKWDETGSGARGAAATGDDAMDGIDGTGIASSDLAGAVSNAAGVAKGSDADGDGGGIRRGFFMIGGVDRIGVGGGGLGQYNAATL